MPSDQECDVLVVGGGPVGLGMAIGLRRLGVSCIVVERHPSTLDFPRGRGITVRTMEIFRQWGLEDDVVAVGLPRDESLYVFAGESLLAEEFSRVGLPPGSDAALSPTQRLICDQQSMEVVLRRAAVDLGADVRFGTAFAGWTADDDGVTADLTDAQTDGMVRVRAAWVVAADGAKSGVRERLGIGRSGPGVVSHAVSILFEAKLGARMTDRLSAMYRLGGLPGGTVLSVDNDRRWLLIYAYDPVTEAAASFTRDLCLELVRMAVGDPSVAVEVVGSKLWDSTVLVADHYRSDRILLAGDAAHVTTPVGGLGMNCGMADVHNLAWKLAGVTSGWASRSLLDTYELERRPVARASGEASLGPARVPALVNGIVLGYRYDSPAVIPDGSPEPVTEDPLNDYVPSARPGHRAPHVWLNRTRSRSTLDLFGSTFVLLASSAAPMLIDEVRRANEATGVPLELHVAPDAGWQDVYGVGSDGGVLVRPDGHVAWRCVGPVAEATPRLAGALSIAAGHG